ncbi:GNAT family N-acetyltransferase [Lutibacter citreus]|uniref:GNAT family N-acetyltransferase n=1 Tax=Lutibacter citreus TaxID=2138210 RepID=UPI000DBE275A|nr:GNAT family N-acetyltransferase [Lutibacter citreus]
MIKKVINKTDILAVEKLAFEIWNAHYTPIIGQEQVDYMLNKFQNFKAISNQLNTGYDYYIISNNLKPVGYIGIVPNPESKKLMISKIYVDQNKKGSGFGAQLLNFTIKFAKENGFKTIWLTVNRYNSNSIKWYHKFGFIKTDTVKTDIGNGFIMDDFILELTVN